MAEAERFVPPARYAVADQEKARNNWPCLNGDCPSATIYFILPMSVDPEVAAAELYRHLQDQGFKPRDDSPWLCDDTRDDTYASLTYVCDGEWTHPGGTHLYYFSASEDDGRSMINITVRRK